MQVQKTSHKLFSDICASILHYNIAPEDAIDYTRFFR